MDVWFYVTRIIQRVETEVTAEYAREHHPYLFSHYVNDDRHHAKLPPG